MSRPSTSPSDAEDALSWTSWSGSTWERVLYGSAMSTSNGVVPLGDVREDIDRAARRLRTATIRAGSIGAALKGGLNLFGVLARSRRRPKRGGSLRLDAADALRDTAAFAAFLGVFAGVYVAVDEGLALRVGKQRSREWRAAVAGAIAAPALLLADPKPASRSRLGRDARSSVGVLHKNAPLAPQRHNGLATYLALRACVLLTRSALKRRDRRALPPVTHALLAPFAHKNADVGLMCVSATVILSCFILRRDAVVGPYAKFLDRHGGKTVAHYVFAGALAKATTASETRTVVKKAAAALYGDPGVKKSLRDKKHEASLLAALDVSDASLMRRRPKLWRLLVHPETLNGGAHFVAFFTRSLLRSFGVNAPLYFVSTLLVHRRAVMDKKRVGAILKRSVVGVARSSAFLSAYCALAWFGPDIVAMLLGDVRWWTIVCGVPLAGLATFLEKPSRRQELGVYCASRALEAVAVLVAGANARRMASDESRKNADAFASFFLVKRLARLDVATFALASAAVMRCYANERDVFRSKYLNVLDYVFGNQGHGRQRVRHVGSAYQLMTEPPEMPASPKKKKGDDEKKER